MRQATPLAHDQPRTTKSATLSKSTKRRKTPITRGALTLVVTEDVTTAPAPHDERLERVRASMRRVRELSAHHRAGTRRLDVLAQNLAESSAQLARVLETFRIAPVA